MAIATSAIRSGRTVMVRCIRVGVLCKYGQPADKNSAWSKCDLRIEPAPFPPPKQSLGHSLAGGRVIDQQRQACGKIKRAVKSRLG